MSRSRCLRAGFALAIAGALFALPAARPLRAQSTGSIEGYILDANSEEPLSSAKVQLLNGRPEARADRAGRFRLTGVPVGEVHVRVEAPGYVSTVEQVTVFAGRSTVVRFHLAPLAAVLEELFVQAERQTSQEDRASGASVGRIEGREVELSVSNNATDLLAGRVPGALVMRSSGQVGAGARILLRGVNSIVLSNEPLIYVDGIRVGSASTRIEGGGNVSISILDLVDPSSIERIEVLRGPAAAMRYGPGSSAGVILIYTKRGNQPDS